MVDLWWNTEDGQETLYCGCCESSIVCLYYSGGEWWVRSKRIPINTKLVRSMNKEQMKIAIEGDARRFFAMCNTSRPATDKPGEG